VWAAGEEEVVIGGSRIGGGTQARRVPEKAPDINLNH